jgi:hypothetical protein
MLDGAMTKLVVVLAVVVVVILVIVIIAARSMRAEDPEEFADRPGGRSLSRRGQDDRYERRESPPGRAGRGGRPPQRQGGAGRPARAGAGRGFDQRRGFDQHPDYDQHSDLPRSRGYDQRTPDGLEYEPDADPAMRAGRGYGDRRSPQPGPDERPRGGERRNGRTQHRPQESQAPARARPARSRRSGDSSEWDSSEWEKLSDVDYWAELASDKPLTTTARPAAQPAAQARSGPDRDTTEALPRRGPVTGAPRQDPATGLPVRGRPQPADAELTVAVGRADFTPAPVPVSGIPDQSRLAPAPPADPLLSRHTDPAGLPSLPSPPNPGHGIPQGRPRVDPDDDPLTSPSFPRIPASDSRSYRNGRADTPSRGASAPSPYMAPTQQFPSYGSVAPDFPGHPGPGYPGNGNSGPDFSSHSGPGYPGNGSRDADTTHPNAYRPDPLSSRDAYPAPTGPAPARPEPAAPATAGNPYGSYVTPDSQAGTPGYGEYHGAHSAATGNGHGPYVPSALPGEAGPPAENGYWQGPPSVPGGVPESGTPSYPDGPGQLPDPLGTGGYQAAYGNGYGGYDQAGYQAGSYPAGPHDPAGYAPLDPYGRDGYGGYPGHGPAER